MRGGVRKGAGRKKIDPADKKVRRTITLSQDLLTLVQVKADNQGLSLSAYIESVLQKQSISEHQKQLFGKEL